MILVKKTYHLTHAEYLDELLDKKALEDSDTYEEPEEGSPEFHQDILDKKYPEETHEERRVREYGPRFKDQEEKIEYLNNLSYSAYLKTEHWKRMRREALRRCNFMCVKCFANNTETELHAHHRNYKHRGQEDIIPAIGDVIILCTRCHALEHGK